MKNVLFAMMLVLGVFAGKEVLAEDLAYTVTTDKTVDEALEDVKRLAKADGFKLPGVHTMPAPTDYVIVEICDPEEAKKLFAVDYTLGILLPCGKVAVYKDPATGRTKIAGMNPHTLTKITTTKVVREMADNLAPRVRLIVDGAR